MNKVKKFQAGGPFKVYQPLPILGGSPQLAQDVGTSGSGATAAENDSLINEKLLNELSGNGLTNDVMQFSAEVEGAYQEYSQMSEIERNTQYGRHLRTLMRGDWGKLNMLRQNKKHHDEAMAKIKANDADSDFAVTSNGFVIKDMETGRIAEVSHAEYLRSGLQNNPNIKMLTNSELINEREYNPHLSNDTGTLMVLNNAIGTTKVKEEVLKVLSNIGSEKKSMATEQYLLYAPEGDKDVAKAARQLVADGIQGFYKVGHSETGETNMRNLQLAAETMWLNLSPNAKSLLRAKAIENGATMRNLEEVAKEMAISLLKPASTTSEVIETTVDYDAQMNKAAGLDGGSGDDESLTGSVNYYGALLTGAGDPDSIEIDTGTGNVMTLNTFSPGSLQMGNKPAGHVALREINELKGLYDPMNAYVGDVKIDPSKLDAVIYTGGKAHRVRMPVTRGPNGEAMPDFEAADRYNKIEAMLEGEEQNTVREEIIRSQGGHPTKVEIDGKLVSVQAMDTEEFIVFDGMINDRGGSGSEIGKSTFTKEADSSEEALYKSLYRYGNFTEDGEKIASARDYRGIGGWFTDVYKAPIFLKVNAGAIASRFADTDSLAVTKSATSPTAMGSRTGRFRTPSVRQDYTLQ